ncbi:fumarylacetoacetate hydrolase family protein [Pseudonocardia sp. T1-2H]
MIFPVPELIARLSRVVTLFPGDLLFTGTRRGRDGPQPAAFPGAG